jgi:hypothetical protein
MDDEKELNLVTHVLPIDYPLRVTIILHERFTEPLHLLLSRR